MENYLAEAFKKLSLLNEEAFDLSCDSGKLDRLVEFVADDISVPDDIDVMDTQVEDEEDICTEDHVGDIIISCDACGLTLYAEEDEDGNLVLPETCPRCDNKFDIEAANEGNMDEAGYCIVGKLAPYQPNEFSDEPEEVDLSDDEEKEPTEADEEEEEDVEESFSRSARSKEQGLFEGLDDIPLEEARKKFKYTITEDDDCDFCERFPDDIDAQESTDTEERKPWSWYKWHHLGLVSDDKEDDKESCCKESYSYESLTESDSEPMVTKTLDIAEKDRDTVKHDVAQYGLSAEEIKHDGDKYQFRFTGSKDAFDKARKGGYKFNESLNEAYEIYIAPNDYNVDDDYEELDSWLDQFMPEGWYNEEKYNAAMQAAKDAAREEGREDIVRAIDTECLDFEGMLNKWQDMGGEDFVRETESLMNEETEASIEDKIKNAGQGDEINVGGGIKAVCLGDADEILGKTNEALTEADKADVDAKMSYEDSRRADGEALRKAQEEEDGTTDSYEESLVSYDIEKDSVAPAAEVFSKTIKDLTDPIGIIGEDCCKEELVDEECCNEELTPEEQARKAEIEGPAGIVKAADRDEYRELCNKENESLESDSQSEVLTEAVDDVEVTTEDGAVEVSKEGNKVSVEFKNDEPAVDSSAFEIAPLSDEEAAGLETAPEEMPMDDLGLEGEIPEEEPVAEEPVEGEEAEGEEVPEEGEDELDIEDFDDEEFNDMGESFMRKTYDNVKSFITEKATMKNDGSFLVEGVIEFKSGAKKPTSFVFESARLTKTGHIVLEGYNKTFSDKTNAFALKGKMNEDKSFVCESFIYNYMDSELNESVGEDSQHIRGRITRKK